VWFTKLIIACVLVAILVHVCALACLETIDPLSFETIAILPLVDPVSVDFALAPLADIGLALCTLPNAESFFDTHDPFAVVYLAVGPREDALTMRFIVQVAAHVSRFVLV